MVEVWTEKYRPKKLSEVKGQEDIVSRLQAFVKSKSMPNLLFAGPAGVGKTASAIAIARELFGENWEDNILELNASDERGIDVIRNKVKDFARTRAVAEVPFKIIYLDEADALTKEAQQALRRTMEDYSGNTRFILSCNYSSKIISPIQSRCAIFRFKPLEKPVASKLLKDIAKKEGLKLKDDAIDIIYRTSEGDMRKAENILQATSSITKNIDKKSVASVISFAEPKEIESIVKSALAGKFKDAKETLGKAMVKHGLSGLDIIKQIQQQLWNLDVDDKQKVELIKVCGEYEFRLVEGSNEFVQLDSLLAEFALIGSK
ncbi:MAG: replication factor C small subunit [Candidatus Woesearchaeota archaeon]|nr:MAG: replication factor C small subunit [Candidatus Woesearchaeota archaeon]